MEDKASFLGDDDTFVFRVNDNGQGPLLLLQTMADRGWKMYDPEVDVRWNLWWRSNAYHTANVNALKDWQFINHIPKGGLICRKDNLSRILRVMKKSYGPIFDFSPPDFHLPIEYAKLVTECTRLKSRRSSKRSRHISDTESDGAVWIYKPVSFSQGKGIFLFRNLNELHCSGPAIVQRYIERPLLIAGYKFDLRLYALVPCFRPLVVYLYCEGLARFSTDKYTLSDIHNPYRHITNSSLNKRGPNFTECKDRIGSGCKWTLKQLRRQLSGSLGQRGTYAKEWLAWLKIRLIVVLTLLAHSSGSPSTRNCFELYGFDVLLDEDLKPWLLEVNLSPALCADCEADLAVKGPMLHELFDLIGLPMRNTGLAYYAPPSQISINTVDSRSRHSKKGSDVEKEIRTMNSSSSVSSKSSNITPLQVHQVNLMPKSKISKEKSKSKNINLQIIDENLEDDTTTGIIEKTVKLKGTPVWGNGIYWTKGLGRVGNWVRVFPHSLEQTSEEVRLSVQSLAALLRAGRASATSMAGAPDSKLENTLKENYPIDDSFQMWLPSIE